MTPVFIPWSNERVFEQGLRTGRLTDACLEWICDNFGQVYFSLTPDGLMEGSRLSFLHEWQALQFKLVWGGK